MNKKVEVNGVIIRDGHIKCLWHGTPGFGELDIYSDRTQPYEESCYSDETKHFEVTTECMGKEFYQAILESMIEYLKTHSTIVE